MYLHNEVISMKYYHDSSEVDVSLIHKRNYLLNVYAIVFEHVKLLHIQ